MAAIDLLFEEHRAFEAILEGLEQSIGRIHAGGSVRDPQIPGILEQCRRFTAGRHHRIEESILFPALGRHGLTPDLTPIAALEAQHESGRAFLGEFEAAYDDLIRGDDAARDRVYVLMREYVGMLRDHMWIEDHYFRSAAANALTPEEDRELSAAILAEDSRADRERFLALAARCRVDRVGKHIS